MDQAVKSMILQGHCYDLLRTLTDESVDCIVTSPPYYGLRKYGTNPVLWPAFEYTILGFKVDVPEMTCELGHEPDPKHFIGHLVIIFREAKRVLKRTGTMWVNMGDSYASSAGGYGKPEDIGNHSYISKGTAGAVLKTNHKIEGVKNKDLLGIPWMMAYAFRDDGWYLRQDIIWAKPNCMPESVTDRCTKSHEYVFMFSKDKKYYYDHESIKTDAKESSIARVSQDTANQVGSPVPGKTNGMMKAVLKTLPDGQSNIRNFRDKQRGHSRRHNGFNDRYDNQTTIKANKRSVWTVPPAQYKEEHFAVFPEALIWDMVLAGCPPDGTVLDPFFGRGTTGVVARKQNKHYIGLELLEKNVILANEYLYKELGFLADL